jgi:alpha-glucuronidase
MPRTLKFTMCAALLLLPCSVSAETGAEGWLRYAALPQVERVRYAALPASVVVIGESPLLRSAQLEMIRGTRGMLGRTLRAAEAQVREPSIVLGTAAELRAAGIELKAPVEPDANDDGFWIKSAKVAGFDCIVIAGNNDRGVLYGAFALLSKIARAQDLAVLDDAEQPYAPIRWVDQWDNLDGRIERGYGGRSIFFADGKVREDLMRARDYARLLASVGINGCAINNVNADPRILGDDFLPQVARVADTFRPWGVRLAIAVDVSSPKTMGGLDTFDPLDPRVSKWWRKKVDDIYRLIPDFGGFVVKADSEGRAGPATYGRTPADAANVIAQALQPHGGVLFYRAFVYNHHLDWREPKNDRARAAYDIFHPLDGRFLDNVIIQIKHGPIDFQVREPASPLFGGLEKTNQAIELQITQEYTGQQRHLVFLAPMWKEVLDFDMQVENLPRRHGGTEEIGSSGHRIIGSSGKLVHFPISRSPDHQITRSSVSPCLRGECSPVKDLVAGKTFHRPTGGFVGVANVGLDANWLGHPLAMANLYAFGRLAWNPNLTANEIATEWTELTFGRDPLVVKTLSTMLVSSWKTYESYTGPLGAGTLTDIVGAHYGPGVESSERNGWGQWHRADHAGIGMDRSVATGTGYAGQYPAAVAQVYESVATTPDELLLFFHHVPYTYKLHSGKTVIQHIYDSHYEGAERAQQYLEQWKSLEGHIDDERYYAVLARLEYQAGHAVVWRDAVANWFLRMSGISDAKRRVGHYADRVEAESMQLQGYSVVDVVPVETASEGKAVQCAPPLNSCSATFRFRGAPGWYDLGIQYFDQNNGASRFRVLVGAREVDVWTADDHLPATRVNGDSSTRRWIRGLALRPGDEIRIEGIPDGQEHAAVDYVEIRRSPWWKGEALKPLSSRPSAKDPARRETEWEWRDPEGVGATHADLGSSPQASSARACPRAHAESVVRTP